MGQDVTPTRIKAPHGATETEITWADGTRAVYPNVILRGFCPCATCQGHGGTIEFVEGGSADLRDLKPVGHYALNLVWADGHSTGIYTFTYLRDLAARDEVIVHEAQGG
ncbi:MAG: DUF971 domain-containing protein [Myxococcota bacterium]